jgi:uncharacterized protein (DUF1330 family)
MIGRGASEAARDGVHDAGRWLGDPDVRWAIADACQEECLDEDVDPEGARGAGPRDRRGVAALAASAARPAPEALCASVARFSRTALTIDGVANSGPARRLRRICAGEGFDDMSFAGSAFQTAAAPRLGPRSGQASTLIPRATEACCCKLPSQEKAMPKAYWIVRVSVRDEERYPEYLAAARPAFEKYGANFIVRGGAFDVMEGNARDRNVVVEFRDRATAKACYESAEYQAAKLIRQKYADADFIIIEGAA